MSAICAVRDGKHAHLLADGGAFDADGRLQFRACKVSQLPHLNAAIAARGMKIHLALAEFALAPIATTFDELKAKAAGALKRMAIENAVTIAQVTPPGISSDFEIAVAGISDAGQPDSFLLCSHGRYGIEPWTLIDLGEFAMLPGTQANVAEIHSQSIERKSGGAIDIEALGRRVMELQRRDHPQLRPDGRMIRDIGGFVQLTTVQLDSITTKIIHRWPDKIGEPISS